MDRTIVLAVNSGEGKTRLLTANANKAVKVKLVQGNKYLLKNLGDNFAPENITLIRVGNELHVVQEGDTQASIIIEDYFNGNANNPVLMGMAEDGQLYAYVPLSGEGYESGYLTANGEMTQAALGGPALGSGNGIFVTSDDSNNALYGLLGWVAAATVIGAGAAIANHNKNDGDNSDTTPPAKSVIGQTMDNTGPVTGPITDGIVTDETRPVLSGTGEPGNIINVYDKGQAIGSTVVDGNGNWTFTPENPLGDGQHQLVTTETDRSGNVSAPSDPLNFGVDTVPPDQPAIQHIMDKVGDQLGEIKPGSSTDDTRPEISGTGEAGSIVTIYDNGVEIGKAAVNSAGRWSFLPESALADGSHNITIAQSDAAGNQSSVSEGWSFTVDTTTPSQSEIGEILDNTGSITGPLKPGDSTDETQPQLSGKGEPGNTIIIEDNGKEIGTTTVDENGNWAFKPEAPLGEGKHELVIIEENKAGNKGQPSDPIEIIVDTIAPEQPGVAGVHDNTGPITGLITNGSTTDETQPEFTGVGEAGNTITIYDNGEKIGSVVVGDNGKWNFKPEQALSEEPHNITVTETDLAGNESKPSISLGFTVDITPPLTGPDHLAITAVEDKIGDKQGAVGSGEITDDSKPLISGIGTAGDTIFVYTTDTAGNHEIGSATVNAAGTWSMAPTLPLLEGNNQLTIVAQDPAGNRTEPSSPSYEISVFIPIATGDPAIISVVDNVEPHNGPLQKGDATNDNMPTLSGTAAADSLVIIYDNGQAIGSTTADDKGRWSFTPEAELADGSHSLSVTATDTVGNVSAPSGSFAISIDTALPDAATNVVIIDDVGEKTGPVAPGETTDDRSPTLGGKAEPGSTVSVLDNGKEIGTTTVDSNGNWTFTPAQPLDNGEHTLSTTVTDPAGNTSAPSAGVTLTVDDSLVLVSVGGIKDNVGDITGNLQPGDVTDDKQPEFTGSGKPGSVVTVKDGDTVLGTTTVQPDGNWSFTPEAELGEGEHNLTVTAVDAAGNTVTTPGFGITVDSEAPGKPGVSGAIDDVGDVRGDLVNGSVTDDATPTLKGVAEAGSTIKVYDNGELIGSVATDANGAWAFTPTTPLIEGDHALTTTATDKAGNTSAPSDAFILSTDYTPSPYGAEFLAITGVADSVGLDQGPVASGGITDDSKPLISGIGTAGDTVLVYTTDAAGNHLIGSATVNAAGTWSMTPTLPLLEGSNQLTIVAVDAAGNKTPASTPSYDLTLDISVPALPSILSVVDNAEPHTGPLQKGEVTNDNTPTLSGSAEAGSTVTVYANTTAIGSVVADAQGQWTLTPAVALADGNYNLSITATDVAGNVSAPSGSFAISIDTALPDAATNVVIIDDVGEKTGPVAPGETTDDRSPTLGGKAEPGSTVSVLDNGKEIGTTTVDSNGNWTFTPAQPLDNGEHTLSTTVTDPAGNTSAPSAGVTLTVDDSLVLVSVGGIKDNVGDITGNLQPGDVTDDKQPEFTGSGKPGSVVTVKDGDTVLGTTTVQPDGSWSYTPEAELTDGAHNLTVTAVDAAGNTVTTPGFAITVDSEAPGKPGVGGAIDDVGDVRGDLVSGSVTDDATPTLKGVAEAGSTIKVYDNGELIGSVATDANGAWAFTPTTPLTEGDHALTTTATDKAGNTSEPSDAFTLSTDYTPSPYGPEFLAITGVADNVGLDQGPVASGGITDDSKPQISGIGSAGDTVLVYTTDAAGNHLIGSATVNAAGTWSMTPTLPLLEGSNQLTIVAVDAAGNKTPASTPSYDLTLDITVPALPSILSVVDNVEPHTGPLQKGEVTNDNTPTLSGSAEAGSTVTVYDNTTAIGSVVADAQGQWTLTPAVALADGNHSLSITATDTAGNVSAPSGSFAISIDTALPEAATNVVIIDDVGEKTGPVAPGETTDDRSPTLGGKAEPGSTVSVLDNGKEIGTTTVDKNGNWTFTPAQPLDNGEHTLSTTVTDPAGNTSAPSAGVTLTVDDSLVLVSVGGIKDNVGAITGNLQPGDVTDDKQPEFTGSGKPGSVVTVKDGDTVLGTTTVQPDGSWSFTPTAELGDGAHTLTVTAVDPAGNTVTTPGFAITVDSEAPGKPGVSGAIDDVGDVRGDLVSGSVTDDATPTLKGVAEAGSTIKVYDNGELIGSVATDANGAWAFTPTTPLTEGDHALTTTATDKAGNTSAPSDAFTLSTDYTPSPYGPEFLAITGVADNVGLDQGPVASGGITDDSKPQISGIGSAGDTVLVYTTDAAGNHLIGSATVNAAGTWSMTPTLPLLEGSNQLTIVAVDAAGNKTPASTPSYDLTLDITVPALPSITSVVDNVEPHTGPLQKGEVTNDNTPTLSGSAEAGSTVTVYDNTTAIGSVVADAQGQWTLTPAVALADGNHSLSITATDTAGNVSAPSGSFAISIDTALPEAATNVVIIDDVGEKTGPVAPGETTDDRSPTLGGKAEPGSTVSVLDNGKEIGTTTVDNNGNWTFTPAQPLDNGEHTLSTTVTDPAGNTSAPSAGVTLTVDDSLVLVSVGGIKDNVGAITGNLQPGDVTDDKQPEFTGSGKPGSVVTVKDGDTVLGTTTVQPDGSWSFTPTAELGEGAHTLTVTAVDPAGNTVTTPGFTITVDSEAPGKPGVSGAIDDVGDVRGDLVSGSVTDDATPTLKGVAEAGSTIKVYDNGELIGSVATDVNGAWAFTPTTPLTEGDHALTTTATDKAGNTSAPSDAFTLSTDYTPSPYGPEFLAITGVADNVGLDQGPVASGGITDDSKPQISGIGSAGDTVLVYTTDAAGNHLIGSATVNAAGTWSMTPTLPLLEGSNQLTIVAVDAAGNKTPASTPSYDFTLDITVPALPSILSVVDNVEPHTGPLQKGEVTNDNTPTLSGSAEAGSTVTLYDNTTAIGSVVADASGTWTLTPPVALADGNHSLSITATDVAGNVSAPSGSFAISIDTALPEAATNVVIIDDVGEKTGPVAPGETTDDRSPTLGGKAEPGSTVSVLDNGKEIGTTTVDKNGNWTFTPAQPLDNGEHTLSTTVTDPAGNTSAPSAGVTLTVDDSLVLVSVGGIKDNVGAITGNLQPGDVTDDTRPEFTGSGKPGSVVTVKDGDTVLGTTTVQPDGSWSFTPTAELGEGAHTLTVTAVDPAGNTVTTPGFAITVDSEAPGKPGVSGAIDDVGDVRGNLVSGSVTDDATPTLKGVAEAGSTIKVYDNGELIGSVATDANGAWAFTPTTPLTEGDHALTTTATDKAGNVSKPSDAFTLGTDYSVPDVSLVTISGVDDQIGEYKGRVANNGITDDNRPTISGTGAEVGNTITLYNGTTVVGTATVQSGGTWALKPTLPLADGLVTLTAKETDTVGNTTVASPAYAITVVTVAPVPPTITTVEADTSAYTGTLQKGAITNDSTPTLKGSALAGGIVTVFDNGVAIGSTVADSNRAWEFTPAPALRDGNHSLTASVTDSIGQTSLATGGYGILVDTLAPDPVTGMTVTDNIGAERGHLSAGGITDDNTPTFSGKAEVGSTVTILDKGAVLGTVVVDSNGDWTFTPGTALDNGAHDFTTTVTDTAGNISVVGEHLLETVDVVPGQVALTNLVDDIGTITGNIVQNGVTDDTRPTLNGTAKPGSIVKVSDGSTVLGSTTAQADGTWNFTPTADLGQGAHSLSATAVDPAGNPSTSSSWIFTVDTVKPTAPTIDSAADDVGSVQTQNLASGSATDDPTPTLSGRAEANSLVTISDQSGVLGSVTTNASGQWSFTPTSRLTEGEHRFTVTAADKAGNISDPSNTFVLGMDFSAPDASKVAISGVDDQVGASKGNVVSNGITDDNRPTISGTGADVGDTITVYNGTTVVGSTTVQSGGTWSLKPTLPLADGLVTLTAKETDSVGNTTVASPAYAITVLTQPPQAPTITSVEVNTEASSVPLQKGAVTNDSTPTLNGSALAGGTVTVFDNGVAIGSTVADSNGTWAFTPAPALKDGNHSLTASVTDSIGQTSPATGGFGILVDTLAPNPVTNLAVTDDMGNEQGILKAGAITDDNTPTFSGKAEAGSTVTVLDNGAAIGTVVVGSNGNWTFTPGTALGNGAHDFTTTVTDTAGNTSVVGEHLQVTVDVVPGQVALSFLGDDVGTITSNIVQNGVTDDTRPTLNGTAKSGSIVTVKDGSTVLGSTTAQADGTWNFTPTADLGQGAHSLSATAVDPAGNPTTSSSWSFTVDSVKPTAPTIDSAADDVGSVQSQNLLSGSATDDPTPTLSGRAEANSIVTVSDQNGVLGSAKTDTSGSWSFTPSSKLPEGDHRFTVTAADAAGNVSDKSNTFVLGMDFSAPDASKVAISGVDDQVGASKGNVVSNGITDDNRPTISGTGADVGDTITVYNGTTVVGSTTVQSGGIWSLKPTLPLADGLVTLTAKETDSVGNTTVASPAYAITVLTQPPQAPTITSVEVNTEASSVPLQKGAVTNDSTPTLNGSALAGGTVTVFDNGVAIGSTVADSNGTWAFTPAPALKDGNHSLTASVTDSIGQTSPATGGFGILVDTLAPNPVTNLTVTDDMGNEQGILKAGAITDDNTPTFSGKAEANSTVTVLDNGAAIGTVVVGSNGDWTFTPGTALGNGAHSFTTTVTDTAGNTSVASSALAVTVDVVPGQVALSFLGDDVGTITSNIVQNGVTDDTRPTLNGTAKSGSIVTVKDGSTVLGSTTAQTDGTWNFTPTADLGQGAHSLSATAVDPAGNPSTSSSWSFTVDSVKPTAPTIDSAADDVGSVQSQNLLSGSATDDPTPTLSGRAEANSLVTVSDQNGVLGSAKTDTSGSWSFTPSSKLPEGDHRFTVTAADAAGNVSDKSNTFVLGMDFSAPDASKVAISGVDDQVGASKGNVVSNGITDDNRPTISGTGADVGDTITVYNGTTVVGSTTVQSGGTWSLKPTLPLADGLVTLTAKETDSVGNTTVASPAYAITVLTQPPQAPTITSVEVNTEASSVPLQKGAVTNDSTPTLNGSALAGGTVTVFDNGVAIGSTVADSKGTWAFTPAPALTDGNHSLTASVTDSIGQTSPATGGFGILVDTLAPNPVTNLTVTDDMGNEQGILKAGAITDDNTPTFSGKAEANSTVTILDNGAAIGTVVVGSNGDWTFTPGTALGNGAHSFTTTVTDTAGNTSVASSALAVTVDVVPGQVALSFLGDDVGTITSNIVQNGVTDDTRPTLNGTAKSGSIVTVKDGSTVLGSTTAQTDGTWNFTPTADLGQGAHSLSATAVDPAGNPSTSSNWSFTIDSVKPTAPTIDSAADDVGSVQSQNLLSGSATDDPTPTLSGRAEANSLVTVSDQNGVLGSAKTDTSGSWSFTPSSKLSEGDHRFTVTAADAAGNVSDKSNTFVLGMDFSAPDASKVTISGVDDQVGASKGNVVSNGITDDNRPTISGTGADVGDTITVYNGTTVVGSTTVQSGGTWSLKPTLPLADGLVTLTAKETDSVGNTTVASPAYAITVLTQPPQAPTITSVEVNTEASSVPLQKGAVTNDSTPTLNGSALAGGTVTVFDNGVAIGSTVADSKGTWAFTPAPALTDGNHSLTASVTDSIGQTSPATGGFGILVDTLAPNPVTNLTVTDDMGNEQGILKAGAITDDNTPTFSGKAEANSTVTILDNGAAIGTVVVGSNGDWTFTPGTALDNGAHSFTTTVTDTAGNTSVASSALAVTVDVVPGQVALTNLVDDVGTITGPIAQNGVTDDTRPTLNGTAKAGSIVTVKDGDNALGSTTAKTDGTWSFTPSTDLGQGAHSLGATAVDPAGNPSASSNWSFTIDSVKPTAPTIDSAADDVGDLQPQNLASGGKTDDPTPTLSGRAEANSLVTVSDQNGVLGSVSTSAGGQWSFTPTSKLSEGDHRFTVTAADAAGNISEPSNTFVLGLDFSPPDVTKIAITDVIDNFGNVTGLVAQNGVLDDRKPVIKGSGAEVGDTITVSTTDDSGNTKVLGTTTVIAGGTWSLASTGSLYDGLNKLSVTETDSVGNVAKPDAGYNVNVSTTPGVPSIISVVDNTGTNNVNLSEGALTKDSTPTLSGTSSGEVGDKVTIYNGTTVVGTTTAGPNGDWSFTPATKLADAIYDFTVTSTNSAGQASSASNSWSITVDTTVPNAVTDLVIMDDVGGIQGALHNGDVTDDAKPAFSGSAEAGSKVSIYDGAVKVGEATANATTDKWSWTPTSNMTDGAHNFTTTVTDLVGNVSDPSTNVSVTIDTKAPEVTMAIEGYYDNVGTNQGLMLGSGGATDDTTPILKGTWNGDLLATDTIRIYQNGTLQGSAVIDLAGKSWTYALSNLLNTNTYTYTAMAVDVAGNQTALSPNFALTIDQDAPIQTVTIESYTDDVGKVTGNFGSGTSTDDRNPTLNGRVNGVALEMTDEVRIYDAVSNQFLGTATVASSGTSWTFVLPALDDDSTNTFRAVVADRAGNEGAISNNFTMTIDLVMMVNTQSTLDTTPIVSGYTGFVINKGEYVEVTVNNKTYSSKNGQVVIDMLNNTWYVQIPDANALAVGKYDVKASLFDASGLQITTDNSTNELTVAASPTISFTAVGATSADTGTALTLSENGSWRILSNSSVFTQTATGSSSLGSFSSVTLSGPDRQQQSTFVDFDRDGLMDILGADTVYANGQQSFKYNGSTYTTFQVGAYGVSGQTNDANANTYVWFGGAAGIDINGDGFVDMVYGDETPLDAEARGGFDTTFVMNTNGTVLGFNKSGAYINDRTTQDGVTSTNNGNATPDREIAGVDLNNDGFVDIVYHGTAGTNRTAAGGSSTSSSRLVVVQNGVDTAGNTTLTNTQVVNGVFNGDSGADNIYTTLTWADLNGDGYMDLFVGGITGQSNAANSVIYYNDGTGKLVAAANGVGVGANIQNLGDTVNSATSLAVDWNADGKMDVIEIAGATGSTAANNVNNTATMWINGGTNALTGQVNWTAAPNIFDGSANASATNFVTGALAIDLDYDGDQDLVTFRASGGKTIYTENPGQKVKDGTSIVLRLLDANGLNVYYGNTVLLVDESTGKVVSSQIINPQGGVNMNNSTGLVYFYGLDASKSYSAVVLANGKDVGGVSSVTMATANAIENVNTTWSGLKAVEANHAYVLTGENGVTASSTATAATDATNLTGIVGTGYNDTLFATAGTHVYNGGGGSVVVSGVKSWSDTGGMDIVDYKLAGSASLTIDLNNTGMQNTGFGNARFVNVEGLAGGAGNDIFTGNEANNYFDGRGGNDTFNLIKGGQDTLMYHVVNASSGNGGNGFDTVNNFTIGTVEATSNADIINVKDLLVGYRADADGAAHYINGVATLDAGDTIAQYLSITYSGNDSILNIDRDGSGGSYSSSALLTLTNTHADLATLLANHQLVVTDGNLTVNSAQALMAKFDFSDTLDGVTANLWTGVTTASDSLLDVDSLVGTAQGDMFTDNSANNLLEGGAGNDTFFLVNGGNDTLMYNVLAGLENDATGGNGHDTVHGFHMGNVSTDSDADLIDLSAVLDYNGPITFFQNENGQSELDNASKGINDYLKVETVGNDTVISIDRDGLGGQYTSSSMITLADIHTDLQTLLQNNQIIV